MQRDPNQTVTDIDTAIRKCLAEGMTNFEVHLGQEDYNDLLKLKPGPITTYRGYPLKTDPKFASQVLHRFEDGRISGYAVSRPYTGNMLNRRSDDDGPFVKVPQIRMEDLGKMAR